MFYNDTSFILFDSSLFQFYFDAFFYIHNFL